MRTRPRLLPSLLLSALVFFGSAFAQPGTSVMASPMGLENDYHPAVVLSTSGNSMVVRFTSGKYAGQEYVVTNQWVKNSGPSAATQPAQPTQAAAPTGSEVGAAVMATPMGLPNGYDPAVVVDRQRNGYTVRFTSGKYAGQEFVVLDSWVRPSPGDNIGQQRPQATATQAAAPPTAPAQPPRPAADPAQGNDPWSQMQRDIDQTIANSKKPPEPAKPVSGTTPFQGLYLRQEQSFDGTQLRHREDYYYFFPDGRVYHGVPPEGPARFNWATESARHPDRIGRYGVQGDRINFSWSTGTNYTWKITGTGAEFDLNMSPTVKVDRFPANARLSGTYHRGSVNAAPNLPTISKATIYTFYPDGTVALDGMKGTDTTNVTVTIDETARGTYRLSGQDLEISWGGQVWSCTAFPQYDGAPTQSPPRVSINGALFERR